MSVADQNSIARYNIRAIAHNSSTTVALAAAITAAVTAVLGGGVLTIVAVALLALALIANAFVRENHSKDNGASESARTYIATHKPYSQWHPFKTLIKVN